VTVAKIISGYFYDDVPTGTPLLARNCQVQQWLADPGIKTIYIEPGSPWPNGFVESFHGRFRDEC